MNMHNPARERSLQELLFHWPAVTRRAADDWSRGFTRSIAAASQRRNWQPTPKQLGVMQRLVSELFSPVHSREMADDVRLIE
jgi:hypothetical protein